MTLERQAAWLFRVNAIINVVLAVPGLLDPAGMARRLGGPDPNYPFVIRLWSGLVLMFGLMFWEVSRDVRGKAALMKYNWIEKTITASAVTVGFLTGDAPPRLMAMIVVTNWAWIPAILHYDRRVRRTVLAG